MIGLCSSAFLCDVMQTVRVHFKNCQVKTHFQTACEHHDLNMDFCLFDNGFKQLCITNSMKNYNITVKMHVKELFCCYIPVKCTSYGTCSIFCTFHTAVFLKLFQSANR